VTSDDEAGWYVYGVVPADAPAGLFAAAQGIDEAPVELVAEGDVAAIVNRVPLREFGEEPLRRNLEVPEWLEAKVRAHDRVLSQAVRQTALVPLRFGTVYRSEDGVRAMLRARADELRGGIERLQDRLEFGVKAFLHERATTETAAPATGRDYLLQKQRERDASALADVTVRASARAVHERLAGVADDARVNPPQPPELSGRLDPMLLNGAYLVPIEREPAFVAAVDDLGTAYAGEGIELELTGPWPPYNFVEDEAVE